MVRKIHIFKLAFGAIICLLTVPSITARAQYSGSTYKIEEAQVGAVGSDNDLQSNDYKARATAGDTAVGIVEGTDYSAVGGFTTTGEPHLEVNVTSMTVNLSPLSSAAASTTSGTFFVRSYLADGYNVFTVGQPPTNENGQQIAPLTAGGTSIPGTSQFGINLRANTSPTTVGADPVQEPDASFSYGAVDTNYNTPNTYRYNNNERIAYSNSSTGKTTYTISYLYNIKPLEQAGLYVFNQSIVVVATY